MHFWGMVPVIILRGWTLGTAFSAVAAVPCLSQRERTGGSVVVGWSAFELTEACLIPKSHAISLIDRKTLEGKGFLENPILVDAPGSLIPWATFFPIFFLLHNPKLRPPMFSQSIAVHQADEENDGYLNKAFPITKIHGEHDSRSSIDGAHDNS